MFLAIAGAASIIAGISLLAADRADGPATRRGWVPKSKLLEVLERPRRVERFIYRHHRLFGGAIVAGALALLAVLDAGQHRLFSAVLPGGSDAWAAALLVRALAVAVLVIGIAVLIRPSALKGVEALSNRWVQLFPATIPTSRQIGVVLLVAGTVCLGAAAKMAGA